MSIGLFNGDDLFLIDQDPLVNDHVRAFIDARILLVGHGRIVSAERSTILYRVRAVSVSGGRVFGGAFIVDFEAAFQVAQPRRLGCKAQRYRIAPATGLGIGPGCGSSLAVGVAELASQSCAAVATRRQPTFRQSFHQSEPVSNAKPQSHHFILRQCAAVCYGSAQSIEICHYSLYCL